MKKYNHIVCCWRHMSVPVGFIFFDARCFSPFPAPYHRCDGHSGVWCFYTVPSAALKIGHQIDRIIFGIRFFPKWCEEVWCVATDTLRVEKLRLNLTNDVGILSEADTANCSFLILSDLRASIVDQFEFERREHWGGITCYVLHWLFPPSTQTEFSYSTNENSSFSWVNI